MFQIQSPKPRRTIKAHTYHKSPPTLRLPTQPNSTPPPARRLRKEQSLVSAAHIRPPPVVPYRFTSFHRPIHPENSVFHVMNTESRLLVIGMTAEFLYESAGALSNRETAYRGWLFTARSLPRISYAFCHMPSPILKVRYPLMNIRDESTRNFLFFFFFKLKATENSKLNSSRPHQRTIQIRIEYNNIKNVVHWPRQWLKPHQATHYRQHNPANATSLFPDDVGSHNIVPDNLCNSSIILADNPWRPSHYPSGMVAP